jgi:hypothetical protein
VPEYVDVAVDFEVDVTKPLPAADSASDTPVVQPGRFRVVGIRHWPSKLIPYSHTIRSGDIWYALDVGDEVILVRAVETTPDASKVTPTG